MNHDTALRAAAVVAAVALVAAPYWRRLLELAITAAKAAAGYQSDLTRVAAAGVLIAFAWGAIPLPAVQYTVPTVEVPTPSDAMQRTVAPVAAALREAKPADKALWAALWVKGARVIAHNDPADRDSRIANTAALRGVLVAALDVGWRRIGGHQAGDYAGLREAVEGAFVKTIGSDQKEMDAATAATAEDLFNAIGWAGLHGG